MSSHHFVKEGQEPALLIISALGLSLAGPLLEWSPLVVCTAQSIDNVIEWGVKLDVVVAPENSVEILTQKLMSQAPIKILASGENEIVETALYFLISLKQPAVTVLAEEGSHLFSKLENFADRINISLLTPTIKWSAISLGHYKKWLPGKGRIYIHGYPDQPASDNLKAMDGYWEVIKDGFIELKAKGLFWLGEQN
jgi:hypothetical protein